MDLLERLILENPSFQAWSDGTPANWSVHPDVLRFIVRHVTPGMRTLETGSGQSTVAFALAGARHTAITLDPGEAQRIRAWLAEHGAPADLTFIHESSDVALTRDAGIPSELDFVFIDGAHRFPFPCLDWHYTEQRLRVGGLMAVDDYAMPSVRILHDFLLGEDEWDLLEVIGRTSFFRRVRETVVINDCQGQRINQRPWQTIMERVDEEISYGN
ncbi:class I SAM-dependent methyltransferase [Microvirga sp. GCM10011540]|uniref:class I SAM-dependent methyltransferase n=1 Tax=Microvirga sp. GCM10011540 TaxID=3317338 RepID=UPI0036147BB0